MSYYRIPLQAGQPFKQNTAGTLLLIDSTGVANGVDVMLTRKGGSDGVTMPGRQTAFRLVEPFEGVTFTSAVDTVLGVFLSTADVQLGFVSGGAVAVPGGVVVTNTVAERVPVDVGGAVIEVTATNVGINNDNANAIPVQQQALATIVHLAPATINTGAAQALVNDATYKRLRIKNASDTQTIAIGGAGVTLANGAIILAPGDMWEEGDAAGAAWYAVADADGADVRVMGVKA